MKKYLVLLLLLLSDLSLAQSTTFESFYKEAGIIDNVWFWAIAAGIALIGGTIIFFTGGTASPIVVSVGTWIGGLGSGLTGIAATNSGLALLGGGSIASGGLGVAGGAALLTAVFTFSTEIVIDYTVEKIIQEYNYVDLVERSKNMTTLSIPVNHNGSKTYKKAIKTLEKINKKEIISSNANRQIIITAINIIKDDTTEKSQALRALLYFIISEYTDAKYYAKEAMDTNGKNTLPEFIYAVSLLYDDNFDYVLSFEFFEDSIINEPNNKLIPLMFAIYLDRYILRFGADSKFLNDMFVFMEHYKIRKFKTQNYKILLVKYFIILKQKQQRIYSLAETSNNAIKENPATLKTVKKEFDDYQIIIKFAENVIKNCKKCNSSKFDFGGLLAKYKENIDVKKGLSNVINMLSNYQNNVSQLRINFGKLEQENYKAINLINDNWQLATAEKLLNKYKDIIDDSDYILDELFDSVDVYSVIRIKEFDAKLEKHKKQYVKLTKKQHVKLTKKQDKKRNKLVAYIFGILLFVIISYIFRGKILSIVRQRKGKSFA